jgi:glycosyltransferase involved in cell wall biosynthesis
MVRPGCTSSPGNADDLCRKVEWALDNPDAMTRMGRCAREEFLGKYTGDRNRDMLVTIYDSVMARGTAMGSE